MVAPLAAAHSTQVSISLRFYVPLFHTKVNHTDFSSYISALYFLAPRFCIKTAHKTLMKLTAGVPWMGITEPCKV